MKKVLLVVLLIIVAIAGFYWYRFRNAGKKDNGPKQQPIVVKKHSDAFNNSIASALNSYFEMKMAFVDADTLKIKEYDKKFINELDSISLDELKKDTAGIFETAFSLLGDVKSNANSLLQQTDIKEMRMDFRQVNEQLYSLLKVINYEGEKIYWQHCPMAFGDDNGANWLSHTEEIINPYLGKNHPEYKGTMLHCGEIKDTIKTVQ